MQTTVTLPAREDVAAAGATNANAIVAGGVILAVVLSVATPTPAKPPVKRGYVAPSTHASGVPAIVDLQNAKSVECSVRQMAHHSATCPIYEDNVVVL